MSANCLCVVLSLAACDRNFSDDVGETSATAPRDEDDRESSEAPGSSPDADAPNPEGDAHAESSADENTDTDSGDPSPGNDLGSSTNASSDGNSADWSAAFEGVYDFEKSGLDLGQDSSGHGRHAELVGSPVRHADHARGAFSALFDNHEADELQYLAAKDEIFRTLDSTSVTVGAWVRSPLEIDTDYSLVANGNEVQGGINLRVRLDLKAVNCMIGAQLEAVYVKYHYVADHRNWNHIACRYDDSAKRVQFFVNGIVSSETTEVPDGIGQGSGELRIAEGLSAAVDEVFFIKQALSDAQIARIGSCGVNGRDCTCSDSDPAEYENCGRLENCDQIPLPPCNSILTR